MNNLHHPFSGLLGFFLIRIIDLHTGENKGVKTNYLKERSQMKKQSFSFFLSICFMFLLCTGVSAADNTGMTGSVNYGNGSGNGTTTTNSYGTNNGYGTNSTATYRTNAANDDNDTDWGWLGLLGLVGLAGLKKRNREHT
jgi:MYXO-CTERM domain-containing protein